MEIEWNNKPILRHQLCCQLEGSWMLMLAVVYRQLTGYKMCCINLNTAQYPSRFELSTIFSVVDKSGIYKIIIIWFPILTQQYDVWASHPESRQRKMATMWRSIAWCSKIVVCLCDCYSVTITFVEKSHLRGMKFEKAGKVQQKVLLKCIMGVVVFCLFEAWLILGDKSWDILTFVPSDKIIVVVFQPSGVALSSVFWHKELIVCLLALFFTGTRWLIALST